MVLKKSNVLLLIFFYGSSAFGAPSHFSYQGQIVKPNGAPLEASNVLFTIDVLSHGAERCLLYQERHTVNMTNSNGIFAIEVGSGVRSGTDYEDTNTLANALSNSTGLVTPTTCASVGTYNPSATHGRKLRVTFNDGSGSVTLSQLHNIVSVPYATNASTIDGLTVGDLLTINTSGTYVLTQANLENLFDTPNHNELLALIAGTSTHYLQATPSADFDMNSNKIVNVDTPTAGTDAANKNYVDANLGGMTLDTADIQALAVGNAGEVLTWNGTQWVSQTVSSTDATKLPLAGGTMSGTLDMNGNDIIDVNSINAASTSAGILTALDATLSNDLTVGNQINASGDINSNGSIHADGSLTASGDITSSGEIKANSADFVTTLNVGSDLTVGHNISVTGGIGVGTGINSGGTISLTNGSEINFRDADDSNFVGFAAPAIVGADLVWTLPAADGTPNQVLQTDGSGMLNWVSLPTGGETNTASNVGAGGVAVYKQKTGVDFEFRSVNAGSNKVTITNDAGNNEIDINVDEAQFALGTIPNTPAGNITATNAQAAINELDTEKVATTRTVGTAADSGLTGGGDLSANRSLSLDIPGTTDLGVAADNADSLLIYDASGSAIREVTRAQFNLSETEVDAMVADNGYALDTDKVNRAGDTMTGELVMGAIGTGAGQGGTISFKELVASAGDDHVGFRAPDSVTTSVIWELPAADGTTGQVLQTNGAGVLSWVAQSAGADDLGDHTATTNLDMANSSILNLEGGSAAAPSLSFNSDANTGLFSAGGDTLSLATAGNERLLIDATGNVTAVSGQITGGSSGLTIYSSATNNQDLTMRTTGYGGVYMASGWGNLLNVNSPANTITGYFTIDPAIGANSPTLSATGSNTNIGINISPKGTGSTIIANGSVGIGTTLPGQKLDVEGAILSGPKGTNAGDGGSIIFEELAASAGSDYIGFRAPDDVTTSVVWQLPAADGTTGQVLQTNGAGVLSWVAASSSSDDLGDHTATTDLDMANSSILNLEGGSAAAPGLSFNANSNTGVYSTGGDILGLATGGISRLHILPSGYVGIGTTSPAGILDVRGGTAASGSIGADVNIIGQNSNVAGGAAGSNINIAVGAGSGGWNHGSVNVNLGSGFDTGTLNVERTFSTPYLASDGAETPNDQFGNLQLVNTANINSGSAMQIFKVFNAGGGRQHAYVGAVSIAGGSGVRTPALVWGQQTGANSYEERMRMDESGNVGIGTTVPSSKLDVEGRIISGPKGAAASDGGSIVMQELVANGTAAVGFRAPDDVTTGVIWQLPAADGTTGHVLQTNGAGVLSWVAQSAGADNLGNHTATTDLGMNNNSITGVEAGSAAAPGLSFDSDPDTGLYSGGANSLGISTFGLSRFTVDNAGNIGIGTTTIQSRLQVSKITATNRRHVDSYIHVGNDQKSYLSYHNVSFGYTSGAETYPPAYIGYQEMSAGSNTKGDLVFGTRDSTSDVVATERMRITEAGTVGIGTSTVYDKLHVQGSILSGPKGTATQEGGGIRLQELAVNGAHSVGFRAPDSVAASVMWELPAVDGTPGHVLQTSGAGVLSWVAQSAGADNLGNHTATADLAMANNSVLGLEVGNATSPSISFNSDANTGIFSNGADTISLATAGVEALAIGSAGNVGIGTTATVKLHVAGPIVSAPTAIASGVAVNLATSNTFTLASVGGSSGSAVTVALTNPANGGNYTIVVTDTVDHTYDFSGCNAKYWKPASAMTQSGTRSIFTITTINTSGSNYDCYITWATGYN